MVSALAGINAAGPEPAVRARPPVQLSEGALTRLRAAAATSAAKNGHEVDTKTVETEEAGSGWRRGKSVSSC